MTPDEGAVFALSGTLAVITWAVWIVALFRVPKMQRQRAGRPLLFIAPLIALALLFLVLKTAAASDVRDSGLYLAFYMVMGSAWIGISVRLIGIMGISPRDDVAERGNAAAAYAGAGAVIAISLCFAGGNIGDGPGWWVVVFSAALSTGVFYLLWLFFEGQASISDAITIDRDPASGIRLAGFLIGCGVILGRAVAGDWESAAGTVHDFAVVAWPVIVLFLAAIAVERITRPTPSRPLPPVATRGALPAIGYIAASLLYVVSLGPAA